MFSSVLVFYNINIPSANQFNFSLFQSWIMTVVCDLFVIYLDNYTHCNISH